MNNKAMYLLRMEAVNLSSVFEDTNQISVIRGASYLLREVARKLPEWVEVWQPGIKLEPISVGASVGLYQCESADGKQLVAQILQKLREHKTYQHFSFVLDAVPSDPDPEKFRNDLEKLISANRWQQMQMPGLSLSGLGAQSDLPCAWNGIRPADGTVVERDGQKYRMSQSVNKRYGEGKELRSNFYQSEILDGVSHLKFTDDLNTLSSDVTKDNLNGKVAVIYLDGNRFGNLQQTHCQTIEMQKKFDDEIQSYRREYLKTFLLHADQIEDYKIDGKLRIEVLMWGGDEILLVVPAWCGLDALSFFYQASQDWKFDDTPLTHAGGLVFAQHKTPISRLTKLAKDLAEGVKDTLQEGEVHNGFDYIVLESIDYPTESLGEFHAKIYRENLAEARQPLSPICPNKLKSVNNLQALSKGQCYALARALVADNRNDLKGTAVIQLARMQQVAGKEAVEAAQGEAKALFAGMAGQDIGDAWRWMHAIELWDYLPQTSNSRGADK